MVGSHGDPASTYRTDKFEVFGELWGSTAPGGEKNLLTNDIHGSKDIHIEQSSPISYRNEGAGAKVGFDYAVHTFNAYYLGKVGKMGIDFNATYFWKRQGRTMYINEGSADIESRDVHTRNSHTMLTKDCFGYVRSVGLTIDYNINMAKSKYKDTGAGNSERGRL